MTRSIPAPAGEPRITCCRTRSDSSGVYPRACGGTDQVARLRLHAPWVGSIPAPAGEPFAASWRARYQTWLGLSPRLRGNRPDRTCHTLGCTAKGLSPRLRGNRPQFRHHCRLHRQGSIPAPAGEPRRSWRAAAIHVAGLSPRLRGNRAQRGAGARCPLGQVYPRACGGTERLPLSFDRKCSVYPRACGGTSMARNPLLPNSGSGLSPRLRGNQDLAVLRSVASAGSIPAPAGEPWLADNAPGGWYGRSIPAPAGEPTRCRRAD